MFKTAIKLLNIIESYGYDAYIVGGTVRDILLNKSPTDIDLTTNMPVLELDSIFNTSDIGKSRDFGILSINYNNYNFELAQFREDSVYSNNRHPDSIKIVSTFFDDSKRRDFTINSIGMNSKLCIIDYNNGYKDIKNKLIKTVGNPYERFSEDYLRMIRAARFAASLNFKIEKETRKSIRKLSKNVVHISPERLRLELLKSAKSGKILQRFMYHLEDLKLLRFILPEIQTLKNLPHAFHHHPEGNVYKHTMKALEYGTNEPIVNLAILLHDIGKLTTLEYKDGFPSYHNHEEVGISLIRHILQRLKFSTLEQEEIIFAVKNHMRFNLILEMKRSKIKKLIDSPYFNTLKSVAYADVMCRGGEFKYVNEWKDKINKIKSVKNSLKSLPIKLIDGNHVMDLTGLSQSKEIGIIINTVSDWIINSKFKSKKQIDNKIIKTAKEMKGI